MAIELGTDLGAPIFVLWGGREGVEADAAKPAGDALERYREAIDFLCGYVLDRGYDMRFAIEPKPKRAARRHLPAHGRARPRLHRAPRSPIDDGGEPRAGARDDGRRQLPARGGPGAVGRQALPHRLERPAHRALRPGLPLRRRRSEGRLLPREAAGGRGLRRPPALRRPAAPRRERGRHLGLRRRLHAHVPGARREGAAVRRGSRIRAARAEAKAPELARPTVRGYSREAVDELLAEEHDLAVLGARACRNERQLVIDLLLGLC